MNNFTHATFIPLIGGLTIGQQMVFGKKPKYLLSFSPFKNNDQHLVHYYDNEVPYILLDEGGKIPGYVDVVSSVCPCAGLSSLSPAASSQSSTNDWMSKTASIVLEQIKPRVLWGENAPRLASKMGEPTVAKLRKIAKDNGYTFSLYKTKSKLHGLCQVRDRSFYFFWKGSRVPFMNYYNLENERIEDVIRNAHGESFDPMAEIIPNKRIPSQEPFYQFVLEELEGGITHQQFVSKIDRTWNPMDYLEAKGVSYKSVGKWMKDNGHDRLAIRCERIHNKLEQDMNVMRKTTEIPHGHIGAFVGHMPTMLTHPDIDRYISIRESLEIMKMPKDFQLQGAPRTLNHICQNVPVTTARDMALEIDKFLKNELDFIQTDFLIQDNRNQTADYKIPSQNLESFF